MSGMMRIRFDEDMPAASVEVLSPDLETVAQFAVQPGMEKYVQVPSEASFIRVRLPSGRIFTLRQPGNLDYVVNRSKLEVKLGHGRTTTRRAPQCVDEVKKYHEFRSSTQQINAADGGRILPANLFGFEPPTLDPEATASALPGGIVTEWTPPMGGHLSLDGHELAFSPDNRLQPYMLRVKLDSTTLVVLFPGNLDAAYVRVDELGSAGRMVSVRVSTRNKIADTMGGYIARGDYYSAETMVPLAEQAEEMLMGKMDDPYTATIAAYLLLRLERYHLMRDWVRNLADLFPFLADGCVIWASQNICQRENYDEATNYLLKAVERGLPLHTEGLRLLSDGLRQCGEPGVAALANLTESAGRVVWKSPFTARLEGNPDPRAVPTTCDVDYVPIA